MRLFGFWNQDDKVHEWLLSETELTLKKTDEICHTAETMLEQMAVVSDYFGANVSTVATAK